MAAAAVLLGAEAPDDKDMARVRRWAAAQTFVNDSLMQVCATVFLRRTRAGLPKSAEELGSPEVVILWRCAV